MTQIKSENLEFIHESLLEILGSEMLGDVLDDAKDNPAHLIEVKRSISDQFGAAPAAGMMIRAGRAGFYYWMRKTGDDLGWREAEFRLLPTRKKTKQAMNGLFDWMHRNGLLEAELVDNGERWQVKVKGLTTEDARLECNYFAGMLQELFSWADGGKFHECREVQCCSRGDAACVFEINKISPD